MTTTIVLADDHRVMREGMRSLLEKERGFSVVGEAQNGREALHLVREKKPDVVVMDIGMPDLNGIDATRRIAVEVPTVKVVALSMHSDRRFVTGMLEAGAKGYVLKSGAYEEVVAAIRAVISGRIYTSPEVTDVVMQDYVRKLTHPEPAPESPLTPREREVLQLMAEGKTTKKIAQALHVSVNTVDTHRHRIMAKLDLHSVAELTKYAIREGLTELE
jgi:DNA-binding NarL/FixJ family response regulator